MTLNIRTTLICGCPAGVLQSFLTSTSSSAGQNISKPTKATSCSRGLPILERASIENSSSNRFLPIGLRYIVILCIFSMIATAKVRLLSRNQTKELIICKLIYRAPLKTNFRKNYFRASRSALLAEEYASINENDS